jgi:hypothetical protein
MPKTREMIQRFGFDDTSFIDVRMACAGASTNLRECPSSGHGVLRNLRYKGVFFESVELDLALLGDIQNYSNIRVRRPDGPAEAEFVFVNDADDQKWLRLVNVRSEADATGILRAFAPKAADHIEAYRFSPGTEVTVNGTIGFKNNPQFNDYRVTLKTLSVARTMCCGTRTTPSSLPMARFASLGDILNFDVNGRLFGDTFAPKERSTWHRASKTMMWRWMPAGSPTRCSARSCRLRTCVRWFGIARALRDSMSPPACSVAV